jgi:hypothetical protein
MLEKSYIPQEMKDLFARFDQDKNFFKKLKVFMINKLVNPLYVKGCEGHQLYLHSIKPVKADYLLLPVFNLIPKEEQYIYEKDEKTKKLKKRKMRKSEYVEASADYLRKIFATLFAQNVAKKKFITVPKVVIGSLFTKNIPTDDIHDRMNRKYNWSVIEETMTVPAPLYTYENFFKNRMYRDPYYLSNLVLILYVLHKKGKIDLFSDDDLDVVAKSAILVIYAKLYNGRVKKFYREGKIEKLALSVQEELTTNKTVRTLKVPKQIIFRKFLPDTLRYLNNNNSQMYLVRNPYKVMYAFSRMWNAVEGLIKSVSRSYYGNLHRLRDDEEEMENSENEIIKAKEKLSTNVMLSLLGSNTIPVGWFKKYEKQVGREATLAIVDVIADNMNNNKFKFVVENYVDVYYHSLKSENEKLDYSKLINLSRKFQRGGTAYKPLNEHVNSFIAEDKKKPCSIKDFRQAIYELIAIHIYLVEMKLTLKTGIPLRPQTKK